MTDADYRMGAMAAGTKLIDMAMGYSRSRMLCAAARLRIADALSSVERTVEQLATACGVDPGSLHRLLRALASIGIVTETTPGSFALTRLGEPLRRDVPHSVWRPWSSCRTCSRTTGRI